MLGKTATMVRTQDFMTYVQYHETDVVMFDDRFIILDSGGWFTSTTKRRMNEAASQFSLGYTVFQKDFEWFVEYQGDTIEFIDQMVLVRKKEANNGTE